MGALKKAARSIRSSGAGVGAAAKYGPRLIQGMNNINEITTTLGNAFAFGEAIGHKNNTPFGVQTALFHLLFDNFAESNNATIANAFKAILIQERKSQKEMVA